MKALLIKIRQILRDRRTRQFLTRFVSVTAAIVVFVTTYALVLPAITMESQAACGIEAHQHDDSCYTEELICGHEESEGHHHTEDCYTVTRELVCSFEEHQHSAENGCYDEDGNLICTLEEHTHTDSCYEEHRELTCGLEESEGHHHTDSCYEKVLTCGKEVHIHSAECYRENQEIQSAAVASTGITSMPAAAAPRSEEGFFSEDVQDEDAGSETLAEPGQINVEEESDNQDAEEESVLVSDDESADKESVNEENSASDAEHVNADNDLAADEKGADADNDLAADDDDKSEDHDSEIKADKDADEEKPADNVNENTDNENIENEIDTDGEGEDAASSFSTGFAADENEENGDVYIPEKEELNFNTVLNRGTGIYYHHVTEDEMMEDSSVITDWVRADEDTELRAEDLIRLYLSYTLPVDSINATNDIARYRLPDTLHLTDDQIDSINECENGISGQYVNFDTLEITDPERHAAYLGLESVEGTRRPDEELKEGSQEFISATVRAEKVYNEDNGEYEGTDLVFTFSPYAVEKNAHAYDKDGQPTRAGEKLSGWLTLDFNMSQIEWAEDSTSEVVFTEEDPENSISRLSTVLKLADPSESAADDSAAEWTAEEAAADTTDEAATTDETAATDETAEAAAIDETAEAAAIDETAEAAATDETAAAEETAEAAAADETAETAATDETAAADETAETAEAAAEDNTAEAAADVTAEAEKDSEKEKDKNEEPTAAEYPAAVFEDSITVSSGRLDTDLADTTLPKKTKMTVHVEADEGTFPEGTKMVLSPVEDLDAVAEAVGTAVDGKTRGFQAVDIAFYDKDPSIDGAKEIEPLKPIRVSIKSDEIKKAAGDASTAPVVVHVEDSTGENSEGSKSGQTGTNEGSLIDASMGSRADEADVLTFEAASFSVYAVVYTVELNATVLSTSGETYEITVNCGENAGIPETAELRVKEILPEESEYSTLRSDIEEGLSSSDVNAPVNPVLFDISIWDGDREIEPAEGSEVKVEIKLVRDSLKGMFTDENTPLLINEKPIQVENGYVEKSLQVIHQAQDGKVSVMDSFDNIGDEQVISTFSTSSFSNWLVFLDETADNITIGIGDTLTLRPYKEWSWDDPSEQGDAWIRPANNPIFRNGEATVRTVTDNNMGQTYTLYEVEPVQTGSFNIQTTTGRTIHVTVQQTSPEADGQKPATVTTVNNADEGITFNLYDYDRDMTLDESSNKAAYWTAWNTNNVSHNDSSGGAYTYNENKQIYHNNSDFNYNTSINNGHYLKFLGWGYSGILSSTHWSKGILDYTGTTVTPKIVSSDLVEVTLTDGTKLKVPKLRNFNENLAYLFNPKSTFTNTNGAVQAYANADGLFQKGSNGYYYYNSNSNYAWYNPATNSFEVYEHTYQQYTSNNTNGNGKPIGFFPFHEYEPKTDTDGTHATTNNWLYGVGMNHNKYLNHHFGMDMAVEFAIPEDGLDEYGNPITFEFSGDDDLWVFIDDKLVLDVGGIHQPVTASINFTDDVVKVTGQPDTTITDMMGAPLAKGESVPHTIRVFYMERGGCDSNLSIRFNMPATLGKGKLSVIKNDSEIPTTRIAGATFGLYTDERCEHLISGMQKTSGTDGLMDFGELAFKDVNTTYYLKEITAPEGYLVDTGVYKVKPYVVNGKIQKDSNGYIVLQVIAPDGNTLAQTNPSDLALSSIEFPNEKVSTIDIPAEKKWADNVVTESAQITMVIKRYKLVRVTKGLTIEQNLIDKPDGHTFQADYTITYTTSDGEERTIFVDYTKFDAGRYTITDIEPGTYTVVQNIRSGVPDNYTRTDNPAIFEQQVTLPEDGAVTAQFNSTYAPQRGTLNLKAVVTNMPSGVSYNNVRYAILDANGKKVTSATYQELTGGKNFSLPVGTYSIKAVNLPKDSSSYSITRTVTKDGVTVDNATISVGNVTITDGGTTSVVFNNLYEAPKAVNCSWKIVDQYDGNSVYASGNVVDSGGNWFNEGQSVRLSFSLDPNKYYGSLYRVTYGGQTLNASDDGTSGGWHRYHVDFTASPNSQLVVEVNRNKNTSAYDFVNNASITTNRSLSMSRAMRASNSKAPALRGANTEEIHQANQASPPEAPKYKKYVKDIDPTTGSDWQRTIVLNKDNTPAAWKDTLRNLEACDKDGNPYFYYVAYVDETGLEEVTTVSFGNDGDNLLLIGEDNLQGNSLNVTNTVKPQGALALTKIVTVNEVDNTTDMTDGDYTFTIEGVADTATAGITHTVIIHFENGRATRYFIDGTRTDCKGTDNSWTVVLTDLTAGDYVITESQMSNENMVLTSVTGGQGDGDEDTGKVTVTVHRGDMAPDSADARATFTNDRTEKVTITVNKVWSPEPLDSENPSITLKLHRYAKKTKGTINITLKDTKPGDPTHVSAPIEGAEFTLYEAPSPDGPWTATSTTVLTDLNGNASISGLEPGKSYKLVQSSTPQRYSYDTNDPPESDVLTVQDNSLAVQEITTGNLTNEVLVTSATVTLTLTESSAGSGSTDNKIDGAKFKLYKDGELYRAEDYETAGGGKIVVSGLPAGEYYFVQTATTTPYKMPADPKTAGFTVEDAPWMDQTNLTQSMTNDLKGKGTITVTLKKDSASGSPIENAEFHLRKGDDLIASATTDANGVATFTNVYEGDYTVHQVNAGDAESDGYEIDPQDKPVSILANSDTAQTPDPVAFVNESSRGFVTVRLWVNQGRNQYNWWKVSDILDNSTFEYPHLRAGETYSFTSVSDDGMYPANIWTYWDTGDNFTDEGPDGSNPYHKYGHQLVTDNIGRLNDADYNGGTYNFTFTIPADAQDGTIYNLAMISNWNPLNIHSFVMNQPRGAALNAAAPQSGSDSPAGRQLTGGDSAGRKLAVLKAPKNAPAVTEAQPHKPSDTDYFEDTVNFTPIEHTITSAPWTYQFPAQDKYDPNGEPYYYYVEETASTPDEYVITSYEGDPVTGTDTGEITITNTRPEYGSLKLTKAVTVNGEEPANNREWAMVTGDYTFTVKDSEETTVKIITLHVDGTSISLVSPTDDADVTLADGVVTIAKLAKGNYTLEETTPTNGTALSNVTVNTSGTVEDDVATVNVKDKNQQPPIPLVTFTNNINTGDLDLTKLVSGEGADEEKEFEFTIQLTAPSGQTLADSYTFKKNGSAASGIIYTKNAGDAARATVTGIKLAHSDVFTIEDLPEGTVYVITENNYSSDGYSSSIPAGGIEGEVGDGTAQTDPVTVTNTLSLGSLTVEKTLEGNATDSGKNFSFSVTLNKAGLNGVVGYYKIGTTETIEDADPVDITFASGTATVTFTLKGGEKAELSDLLVGTTFTVNEISKDSDGYETTASSTGGTVNADKTVTGSISATTATTASYVNRRDTTTAEAVKEWKSGAQTIVWPEDVSKVEFTLFAKIGDAEPQAVNSEGIASLFTGIEAVKEINKDTELHKAVWNDLPVKVLIPAVEADPANGIEASPAEWKPVSYSVRETKIFYTNGTQESTDVAEAEGVITNEIEKIRIHASKKWKNKNGVELDGTEGKEIPTGAQVTFTLVKDGTEDSTHTVVLNGVDETKDPVSGQEITPQTTDYEGAGWTAWFTDLPKHNHDGTLISYSVKETGKWPGFEIEGSGTAADEGTIVNKESTTDINILKVEDIVEKPLSGAKFVLRRYDSQYHEILETWAEQETSAEQGMEGKLTFEKLQLGSYELEETLPPPGYIKTNTNPRFTVTADQNGNLVVTFVNSGTVTYDSADQTFTVRNEPGEALPYTGGSGTRLFTILGSVLLAFAGILLIRRQRTIY